MTTQKRLKCYWRYSRDRDDLMLVDEKLQEDLDNNTIKLVNDYYTEMIKLQARVAILEKLLSLLP